MKQKISRKSILIIVLTNLIAYSIFIIYLRNALTTLTIGSIIFITAGSFLAEKDVWKRTYFFAIFTILIFWVIAILVTSLSITQSINLEYIKRTLPFRTLFPILWSAGFGIGLAIDFGIKDKNIKRSIQVALIGLVLSVLGASVSFPFQFVVTGLVYMIGAYIITKPGSGLIRKNIVYYLILVAPFLLIFITIVIGGTIKFNFPTPILVIFAPLLGAWIKSMHVRGKRTKMISVISLYVVFLFAGYVGMLNWIVYLSDKQNPSNLTSLENISFITTDGIEITEENFQNKNVVLYFWSTTCSVCYQKFPALEKIHQELKEKNDYELYAVCCINPRTDEEKEKSKVLEIEYDFQILFAESSIYRDLLEIHYFPQLILIDKEGKIILNGDLIYDPLVYVNNIKRVLKAL